MNTESGLPHHKIGSEEVPDPWATIERLHAENENLRGALGTAIVYVPNHVEFIEHYGLDWIQ